MMLLEQIGLERFAPDVGGQPGHVHYFTGSPNRKHTPERNILRRGPQRDFPPVRFDDLHDQGGNQQDEECDRLELRRCIVDLPMADMPGDEHESDETDNE